jgi:hypothetical protein
MNGQLTLLNLMEGIRVWRKKQVKDPIHWPSDFHNRDYQELRDLLAGDLDNYWWECTVDVLVSWKATRGRMPVAKIIASGQELLPDLKIGYERILRATEGEEPTLDNSSWTALKSLFDTASEIKNRLMKEDSPVFGSKLCHFIFPSAFVPVDREVLGFQGNAYPAFWQECQRQWVECKPATQADLVETLKRAMGAQPVEHFPWCTKITELCLIGCRPPHD